MQLNILALIKNVIFTCVFLTTVLSAMEDKAVYCVSKEEPKKMILVHDVEYLFSLPDTLVGNKNCGMISLSGTVDITGKSSMNTIYMHYGGGGLLYKHKTFLHDNGNDNPPEIIQLPPEELPDQIKFNYPNFFIERKEIFTLLPNKGESFTTPVIWNFGIKCRSGQRIEHLTSAEIYISGFCTDEQLKAIQEQKKE